MMFQNVVNFSGWLLDILLAEDELSLAVAAAPQCSRVVKSLVCRPGCPDTDRSRTLEDPKRLLQMLELEESRE